MRTFLIDTDTASDDAVAILMALAAPDVRVAALTTVAGNVGLEQATRNALYAVEIAGSDVPVFKGAAAPLVRRTTVDHRGHLCPFDPFVDLIRIRHPVSKLLRRRPLIN